MKDLINSFGNNFKPLCSIDGWRKLDEKMMHFHSSSFSCSLLAPTYYSVDVIKFLQTWNLKSLLEQDFDQVFQSQTKLDYTKYWNNKSSSFIIFFFSLDGSLSPFILRTQLRDPHFFQKRCHFCWLCFDFSKNDNAFERNEDRVTGFLKWTNFRKNLRNFRQTGLGK